MVDDTSLTNLRDTSLRIAEKKGYAISRLAVMPDHLRAALGGNCDRTPQEIVAAFQNNLAYAMGQTRFWEETHYTGTFSEYDMDAIRTRDTERRIGRLTPLLTVSGTSYVKVGLPSDVGAEDSTV